MSPGTGRCTRGRPGLILLDAPTGGLAPLVVRTIQETLHRIKREGVTVLLAEQNARMALDVGDWHHIIDDGRIHFSGDSRTILGNDEIMTQYLGVSRR